VKEDVETLAELMLHADQFCSNIEAAIEDVAPNPERKELRTKLGQCRAQLAYLQNVFDEDSHIKIPLFAQTSSPDHGTNVDCVLRAQCDRLQNISQTRYD